MIGLLICYEDKNTRSAFAGFGWVGLERIRECCLLRRSAYTLFFVTSVSFDIWKAFALRYLLCIHFAAFGYTLCRFA
jgi:hypothetical protein